MFSRGGGGGGGVHIMPDFLVDGHMYELVLGVSESGCSIIKT